MDDSVEFESSRRKAIKKLGEDESIRTLSNDWFERSIDLRYSYNFNWLGRPVIQYPQDIVALQEIIWECKPDLIIETGVARGGSVCLSASMLATLDMCDALTNGPLSDFPNPSRKVIAIDIDIRKHNHDALKAHPLFPYMHLIQGSSVADDVVAEVKKIAKSYNSIMVILDSNHTHDHVLAELQLYSDLVTDNSYCVVFDTVIENLPKNMHPDRPWEPGNSPMTALDEFLANNSDFSINGEIDAKLQLSVAPRGYLKKQATS